MSSDDDPHRPGARPVSEQLGRSLAMVAAVLADAGEPWWVIAGAACVLHGVEAEARDVDILLAPTDARLLLPSRGVLLTAGAKHPHFRSELFGVWRAPPLPVEFMAGFEVGGAGGWARVAPVTRLAIPVAGTTIPVPARAELAAMLRAFGRPKDLARARMLEA